MNYTEDILVQWTTAESLEKELAGNRFVPTTICPLGRSAGWEGIWN
jgi:hypothetical protein